MMPVMYDDEEISALMGDAHAVFAAIGDLLARELATAIGTTPNGIIADPMVAFGERGNDFARGVFAQWIALRALLSLCETHLISGVVPAPERSTVLGVLLRLSAALVEFHEKHLFVHDDDTDAKH